MAMLRGLVSFADRVFASSVSVPLLSTGLDLTTAAPGHLPGEPSPGVVNLNLRPDSGWSFISTTVSVPQNSSSPTSDGPGREPGGQTCPEGECPAGHLWPWGLGSWSGRCCEQTRLHPGPSHPTPPRPSVRGSAWGRPGPGRTGAWPPCPGGTLLPGLAWPRPCPLSPTAGHLEGELGVQEDAAFTLSWLCCGLALGAFTSPGLPGQRLCSNLRCNTVAIVHGWTRLHLFLCWGGSLILWPPGPLPPLRSALTGPGGNAPTPAVLAIGVPMPCSLPDPTGPQTLASQACQ